ncbi:ABC transporter ATP-binding protein [Oceanivirga salmonicida]|uniref:ABC transporter ATP-binding protein n=1 Tax=Oceanivirga salmonicida TaxID=1769291 RepID=UPI00082F4D09|nr:ABC transporter ATP-binding protein [Oceanivirga salmonicida]
MISSGEYVLEMRDIVKVYNNGFVANNNVNLLIKKGEIHALVGENGAGKSTLMKMLFGVEKPTKGKILLNGKEIKIDNPLNAINYGIGMVHQHFMLAPSLTVMENMIMGIEPKKNGFIDYQKAEQMVKQISEKYNLPINPLDKVEDLPVGIKQRIEILKALLRGADILILDEPTAVLTPQETEKLFVQLKKLKENGHTIIFISHKLKEIKQICDRLTILRHGKSVGVKIVKDVTEQEISKLMVGRDVILKVEKEEAFPTKVVAKIRNLKIKNKIGTIKVKGINFDVRKGEILGIAGIEGNGQTELAEAITGISNNYDGEIKIKDLDIKKYSIRKIRELGTAHVPEDRMTYGIVENGSIKENLIASSYYKKDYNKFFLFKKDKIEKKSDLLIENYKIKCDDKFQPVKMLSGGNIQKVVVAREFSSNPEFILINQPTRGVDVGAIEFIHKRIVELRDNGTAVLLISADLNEVLELSDSLLVMCEGKIVAYFKDTSSVTEKELGEYLLGLKKMNEVEIGGVVYEK